MYLHVFVPESIQGFLKVRGVPARIRCFYKYRMLMKKVFLQESNEIFGLLEALLESLGQSLPASLLLGPVGGGVRLLLLLGHRAAPHI